MNMLFVDVGSDHHLILVTEQLFCQFHADLVGHLRRDFPRLKTLLHVVAESAVQFSKAGLGIVHLLGCALPIIGVNKHIEWCDPLSVISLCRVHNVFNTLSQLRLNRPYLRLRHLTCLSPPSRFAAGYPVSVSLPHNKPLR